MTATSGVDAPPTVRMAEALAALSLATDGGNGLPLEKSMRNAVIAVRLGERLGLDWRPLSDVFCVTLLRSIGCTAYAHETAALLGGDDVAFHAVYETLDPGGRPRCCATSSRRWARGRRRRSGRGRAARGHDGAVPGHAAPARGGSLGRRRRIGHAPMRARAAHA